MNWLPVFTSPACCDILVSSFAYCREHKGLQLHGWVIMDNHFHAVATAPDLSAVLADLKKFTARRLLEQLAREGRDWLPALLATGRARHKTRRRHQVSRPSTSLPLPLRRLAGRLPSAGHPRRCHDAAKAGVSAPQPRAAWLGRLAGALALLLGPRVAGRSHAAPAR